MYFVSCNFSNLPNMMARVGFTSKIWLVVGQSADDKLHYFCYYNRDLQNSFALLEKTRKTEQTYYRPAKG